jgi:S-adenosylmethionine:tRNA ribosyltransferase-isomerase
VEHRSFRDLRDILRSGDLLVVNDTRVTALRLFGRKSTGAAVEALVVPEGTEPLKMIAYMKPGRRLREGDRVLFENGLAATVEHCFGDGRKRIAFEPVTEFERRLAEAGEAPLPPYVTTHGHSPERYQTVYAASGSSLAAPTAGLHFSVELLAEIEAMGVAVAKVTLDVGLDTFRPIKEEDAAHHRIHGERCAISPEAAEMINARRGRLVAVGTTSVRTLETFADAEGLVRAGETTSMLYITPGYEFKVIDGLITNFHMPRTTMLLMLAALTGREALMAAYREACQHRYRFLSFGDSMLIL